MQAGAGLSVLYRGLTQLPTHQSGSLILLRQYVNLKAGLKRRIFDRII